MEKTTNISMLVDKIRRHPLLESIPFETILDYLVDFIHIVGTPQLFEDKTSVIDIKDYRGLLPCDFVEMVQVRTSPPRGKLADDFPGIRAHSAYRYAGDSFHLSPDKPDVGRGGTDLTYRIQGSVIYTSTKDRPVEIAYRAYAVDGEGYPLIPENASFYRAFQAFVKKEWFTIKFDMGELPYPVLQQAQQDYAWAVGDCEAEAHRLTLDKAETLFNSWNNLIIRATAHRQGFVNEGTKEYLTLQP